MFLNLKSTLIYRQIQVSEISLDTSIFFKYGTKDNYHLKHCDTFCATICIYPSNVIYHVSSRYTLCILNIYFYYLFGNFPTVKNILQSMFLENIFSRIDI